MICLRCGAVAPHDAVFCQCGRSFGGRLCPSRHKNPMHAGRCFQCGRQDLTEGARYVSLRVVSRVIAWAATFLALRWGLHHVSSVIGSVEVCVAWILDRGLGFQASALISAVYRAVGWYVGIMALTVFLPKQLGGTVRSGLNRGIGRVFRYGWKALVWSSRAVWVLLEGRAEKPKRAKSRGHE